MESREIPLTQGKVAIVDAEDYEWLSQWKWYAHKGGNTFYARRHSRKEEGVKRIIPMHRIVLGLSFGDGKTVDHRDRNGLNNRRHNLIVATKTINGLNSKLYSNNLSGFRGVHWNEEENRWRAQIKISHKMIFLGRFESATDAARAYDKAAIEYRGSNAILNFPEEINV